MRVSKFKGCQDSSGRFAGIKLTLQDPQQNKVIDMSSIGDTTSSQTNAVTCNEVNLSGGDIINLIEVEWDSLGISLVSISTKDGINSYFGQQNGYSKG